MSRKLTILIDMDDTITNLLTPWVNHLNQTHGTNVLPRNIKTWDLKEYFPGVSEDELYQPLGMVYLWDNVKPLPGAYKYIKKLKEDGHSIFVVTASHPETISVKLNNTLFKYFPFLSYKDVIVAHKKQMINGDVLIDDAPHNLEGGKYFGILKDAAHNRWWCAKDHGCVRAYEWKEIYDVVCKIADR